MLSFIYRLFTEFRKEHGIAPNLLYLSPLQMRSLRNQLEAMRVEDLHRLLGMELVISDEVSHPHVAWCEAARRHIG